MRYDHAFTGDLHIVQDQEFINFLKQKNKNIDQLSKIRVSSGY